MSHPRYWKCTSPGCDARWASTELAPTCPLCGRKKRVSLPSVTTVLGSIGWNRDGLKYWAHQMGLEGKDLREEMEREATVGTIVHLTVAAELHGRALDLPALEWSPEQKERAARALGAWKEWRSANTLRMIGSEVSLCSSLFDYGGTMDAVSLGGHVGILDLKSGRIYPEACIQVAAYGLLWNEHHPEQRVEEYHLLAVGKDDGSFHHHRWPLEAFGPAIEAWGLALELHRRKKSVERMLG